MINKNKILREAVVLFIVTILILSTGGVTAITYEKQTRNMTQSKVKCISTNAPVGVELLAEGFEDGEMPPPGGWSTINNHPIYNWDIVDNDTYPDFVHSGDYAGWVNWDNANSSDEWLVSPDIDLTGFHKVTLVFWAESDTKWPGATVELHIRGPDFDDIIWDMIEDEDWHNFTYREMVFDLSDYKDQIINISWRYVGFDGQSFGLDDILLIGAGGIESIPILNITKIRAGKNIITVELKNFGNEPAYDIIWRMFILEEFVGRIFRGFLFFPKHGEGTIPSLYPGDTTEFNVDMKGLGLTKVSFNLLYTIKSNSRCEVEGEVFQEENVLGVLITLNNELIPQPERTWVNISDADYSAGIDKVDLYFNMPPYDIHHTHKIRLHDKDSSDILFQSSCSFEFDGSVSKGTVKECHITKSIVETGNAYWQVELVNGK